MIFSIRELALYNENITLFIYKEYLNEQGFQCRNLIFRKTYKVGFQNSDSVINKERKALETVLSLIRNKKRSQVEEYRFSEDKDLKVLSQIRLEYIKVPVLTHYSERQLKK